MLKFLAFAETLRTIVLDYVKSIKYGIGLLLSESLMPVLQFIYRDLTRTGLRDHLLGYTHGMSEDMSTFSTHLMYYLGKFMHFKMCNYSKSFWIICFSRNRCFWFSTCKGWIYASRKTYRIANFWRWTDSLLLGWRIVLQQPVFKFTCRFGRFKNVLRLIIQKLFELCLLYFILVRSRVQSFSFYSNYVRTSLQMG